MKEATLFAICASFRLSVFLLWFSCGDHILINGVELGFISVPLHKIFLKSDLLSGYVTVGIRPNLPIKGLSNMMSLSILINKLELSFHLIILISYCILVENNIL